MISYDSNFYLNEQITEISEINNDLSSLLNSEVKDNISYVPSEFQGNINPHIDEEDIISEKLYFNKNISKNDLLQYLKGDNNFKKTISIKKGKKNYNYSIQIKICTRGRKNKNSKEERNHSKFTFDNILRKIKTLAIRSYLKFINKKIKNLYSEQIQWKLEKINQENVANAKIDFNRKYFNTTFKEIFSEDITTKWKNKDRKYNKKLVESLLNEKDDKKRKIFVKLLNFKLIDIVKYLRGEKADYEELKGLEFEEYTWNNIKKDEEYLKSFLSNMKEIEVNLKNKLSRNRKKLY